MTIFQSACANAVHSFRKILEYFWLDVGVMFPNVHFITKVFSNFMYYMSTSSFSKFKILVVLKHIQYGIKSTQYRKAPDIMLK